MNILLGLLFLLLIFLLKQSLTYDVEISTESYSRVWAIAQKSISEFERSPKIFFGILKKIWTHQSSAGRSPKIIFIFSDRSTVHDFWKIAQSIFAKLWAITKNIFYFCAISYIAQILWEIAQNIITTLGDRPKYCYKNLEARPA